MTSLHYNEPRLNYILQLFKPTPETPSKFEIAYNVTGVTAIEGNEYGKTNSNERDGGDYFVDPDEEEIMDDNYNRDNRNIAQKVVFVIDDSVETGVYRGRIYNSDGDTISVVVKGMIQVAEVDGINENDSSNNYIIDDIEDKTGMYSSCVLMFKIIIFSQCVTTKN